MTGPQALFYGLCWRWDVSVWTEKEMGQAPADFYLPEFSLYIITGLTADDVRTDLRPELLSLPAASTATVLLERLDDLRRCHSKGEASRLIGGWARFSGHAAEVAQDLGLTS